MSQINNIRIRRETGYTLIEMLVVISITGLIMIPLTMFMINGLRSYSSLEAQSNTSVELNILANRVTKVVRGATTIDTAEANTLIIYGYFSPQDTVVKKIRYFINGTNLNIGVTPPSGTAPNYVYNPADEKIYTTRIDLVMQGQPLFTYYDDAGNQLPTGFNIGQIKNIGIFIAANPNGHFVNQPISISTRVTLRNAKTNL